MSIVLSGLTKRFDRHLVVNNVSLDIAEGELFVLLGGSGSGKSTILRLIAGLSEANAGRIEMNGRDVTYLPPQARGVGFVFQNYSIFRHMTIAQNIEFGLLIRRVLPRKRRQRSEELLELVGLSGLGGRYPDQLSGGQQQRVALARALAYKPEVLLLDEPFGALDVKIRTQLRASLKEIQRQLKVTTILVTHDQEEAFELADRIGLLDRGSLIEVGTPQTLYHQPATEFAAIFIGGGNVLAGRHNGDTIQLGSVALPTPPDTPVHDPGAPVRILFRPETVVLQTAPFDGPRSVHVLGQGQVTGQAFSGSSLRIRLEVEGLRGVRPLAPALKYGQRTTPLEASLPSVPPGFSPFATGQTVWVGLSQFHVLSPGGLKVLLCYDGTPAGEAAAAFGLRLAEAARGPTTLMSVAPTAGAVTPLKESLDELPHKWSSADNPHLRTLVRQGDAHVEILSEAQAGYYELVVLGRSANPEHRPVGLGSTASQVLTLTEVPVLLVSTPRERIERVLICTAAGEPGKSVIRFGARLARETAAFATILHVLSPQAAAGARARAEFYLEQARAFLGALGVQAETQLGQGTALGRILSLSETGHFDLLLIGASAPHTPRKLTWTDLASQIVAGTSCPVVVVPMQV